MSAEISSLITHHSSLRPSSYRLNLIIIPHERDDVAGGVADEVLGHFRLVRVDAVLGLGLPWAEDCDFAAQIAIREDDFRADAHSGDVDRRRIEYAHA